MDKKLNIGVFGVGHLGRIHTKLIKEIEGFNLIGFYDPNDENAQQAETLFGVKRFLDQDELIDLCDCIDIVSPTIYHYDGAVRVLKKSKHLFIEKPLTSTTDEAKALVSLSKEANVKVQVGHVERFNPAFEASLPYFNNPMFIETHRLSLFNPRGTDVSVVLDLMIHDIDIVLAIVKSPVLKISASGVAVVSSTPDIANARIEFNNGCVANLTASRISMKNMRKSRFFQKDAYISVDFLEKQASVVKLKMLEGEPGPFDITVDLGEGKGTKQLYFENPEVKPTNAIKKELETFRESIINQTPLAVSIDDGYKALDIAYQVIEKLRLNS